MPSRCLDAIKWHPVHTFNSYNIQQKPQVQKFEFNCKQVRKSSRCDKVTPCHFHTFNSYNIPQKPKVKKLEINKSESLLDGINWRPVTFILLQGVSFLPKFMICLWEVLNPGVVILQIENKSAPLRGLKIINLPQNRALNFQKLPYF